MTNTLSIRLVASDLKGGVAMRISGGPTRIDPYGEHGKSTQYVSLDQALLAIPAEVAKYLDQPEAESAI